MRILDDAPNGENDALRRCRHRRQQESRLGFRPMKLIHCTHSAWHFGARSMEALPSVAPPQSFLEPRPAPTPTAFKQPPAEADSTSSSLLAPAVTRPRLLTATTTTISLLCRARAQGGAPRAIAAWPPDLASAVPDLAPWTSLPPTSAHASEAPAAQVQLTEHVVVAVSTPGSATPTSPRAPPPQAMVPRQIREHGSESPRRCPPREPRGLPAAPSGDGGEERRG